MALCGNCKTYHPTAADVRSCYRTGTATTTRRFRSADIYAGPNTDAHPDGGCRRCVRTGQFITGTVNGTPTGPGGPCFRCAGKGRQSDCGSEAHAQRAADIDAGKRDTSACCDRVRNDLYDRFGIRLSW